MNAKLVALCGVSGVLAAAIVSSFVITRPAAQPISVEAALDTSKSNRPHLASQTALICGLTDDLDPTNHLSIYSLNSQVTCLYSDAPPVSSETLEEQLVHELPMPSTNGTYPAAFWKIQSNELKHTGKPCLIVAGTDGDNDNETPISNLAIKQFANEIATNPNVVIVIIGVSPKNFLPLAGEFKPLGPRLHLATQSSLSADTLSSALSQVRSLAAHSELRKVN